MSKRLSFDQIVAASDITTREVQIAAWGGSVLVAVFTKADQAAMRAAATVGGDVDKSLLEKQIVLRGMVEPELTAEQIDVLWVKSASAVDEVLRAILEVNKLLEDSVDEAAAEFRP